MSISSDFLFNPRRRWLRSDTRKVAVDARWKLNRRTAL